MNPSRSRHPVFRQLLGALFCLGALVFAAPTAALAAPAQGPEVAAGAQWDAGNRQAPEPTFSGPVVVLVARNLTWTTNAWRDVPELARVARTGWIANAVPGSPDDTAELTRALGDAATVVDVGDANVPPAFGESVRAALARVPADARVIVVSTESAGLQVFAASGPGLAPAVAHSASTRRAGLVTIRDVTATAAAWAGQTAPKDAAVPLTASVAVAQRAGLVDQAAHSDAIQRARGRIVYIMTTAATLFFLATTVLLAKPVYRRTLALRPVRTAWRVAGMAIAATPAACLLANAAPWWRAAHPARTLGALIAAIALIAALACLATAAIPVPRRYRGVQPYAVVTVGTALLVLGDAVTGSRLAADSAVGFNLVTGARFYGVGNEAFALLAAGALIGLGFLGNALSARVRTEAARGRVLSTVDARADGVDTPLRPTRHSILSGLIVGLVGLVVVAVDGLPRFGADFGGVLALLPAVLVLAFIVTHTRVSAPRVAGAFAVTVLAAVLVAVLDWLRPPAARTHLGQFVQSLLDGDSLPIVARKAATNLRLLVQSSHTLVVLAGLVLGGLALWHAFRSHDELAPATPGAAATPAASGTPAAPVTSATSPSSATSGAAATRSGRLRGWWLREWGWLRRAEPLQRQMRGLASGLGCAGLAIAVGYFVNDSGIVIPGMAAILVLPALAVLVVEARPLAPGAPAEGSER